jgi:hypothetical protein
MKLAFLAKLFRPPLLPERQARWWLHWLFWIVVLTAIGAPILSWDYLGRELRWMGWRNAALIWLGDIVGLLWFIAFHIRHGVLGRPLLALATRSARLDSHWYLALAATLMLFASDCWMAYRYRQDERQSYRQARRVEGSIVGYTFERHLGGGQLIYRLQCRCTDDQGRLRTDVYDLNLHAGYPPATTQRTIQALERRQAPFPIEMAYDPDRYYRIWIPEFETQ